MKVAYPERDEDIAIIGMSGRFPAADSIQQLWSNLCAGKESIESFTIDQLNTALIESTLYSQSNYVAAKGIINNVEKFDAGFFGLSKLEADILDPQHRLFMMCVWEALENAGYQPKQIGKRTGVFASSGLSHYLLKYILNNPKVLSNVDEYQLLLSHDKDFLATRISYLLNLQGPSLNIQTGCSSSLVCVHYACQSILNGECDYAIAGGVSITLPQEQGYIYKKDMIGSPDGHCYAFDERAQGTVKSNGLGVVVLKPLSQAIRDNDHIYSVIRGSAVNNDGADKVGFTAPSVSQQSAVIKTALRVADLTADKIEYVECHGTGTILGDPIEISGLKQAFNLKTIEKPFCALASLKTNLGHLDVAAGVAGLIKASLAVYYGLIPASLNFNSLNNRIDLDKSPFYINNELRKWQANELRRAGVSAFGVGGTNAHVIVQEPPRQISATHSKSTHILTFSAKSKKSLLNNVDQLTQYINSEADLKLEDIEFSLNVGRQSMPFRTSLIVQNESGIKVDLTKITISETKNSVDKIVFMFSGQGSQYPNMASELYKNDLVFKNALDECISSLTPYLSFNLLDVIYRTNDPSANQQLMQTEVTQPALFAIEYALAKTCITYGVKPAILVGHSIGEYAAAVIAGIFTLSDAARLVAKRGQIIQNLPKGSMLAVLRKSDDVAEMLPSTLDIALENAPEVTVVSGPTEEIKIFAEFLKSQNIVSIFINTSHAFHSRMLDSVLDDFRYLVRQIRMNIPNIPIVSNVTGNYLSHEQATNPEYWVSQLRSSVKFTQGVETIHRNGPAMFIEIGPGNTLQNLVSQHGISQVFGTLPAQHNNNFALNYFYEFLSKLWQKGVDIKLNTTGKRIPLPTYAWDLKKHWIDQPEITVDPSAEIINSISTNIEEELKKIWENILGSVPQSMQDNFFTFGGNSLSAIQLIDRLPLIYKNCVSVVDLYQYPKFGQFVDHLKSIQETHESNQSLAEVVDEEKQLFSKDREW